jgi:hypothetical protein
MIAKKNIFNQRNIRKLFGYVGTVLTGLNNVSCLEGMGWVNLTIRKLPGYYCDHVNMVLKKTWVKLSNGFSLSVPSPK